MQCKILWDKGLKDDISAQRVIAIGRKNGIPSYVQCLSDMYIRDKIRHVTTKKEKLSLPKWAETNFYMQQVKTIKPNVYEDIIMTIKSMYHRTTPEITFPPLHQIQDDLAEIAEYIVGAYKMMIQWMPEENSSLQLRQPPWQFDVPILFRNVSEIQLYNDDDDDSNDDDDDSNDDDDDSNDDDDDS
eukprot:355118_1